MKFKEGEWVKLVRDDGILFHIFHYSENFKCQNGFRLELWQPEEGDWIVIYPTHPRMNKPTNFTVRQYFSNDPYWKLHIEKCEPFIGMLPDFIKENK